MRGLSWATTMALLAGLSGAAGKDGGYGSRASVPLPASKQALKEISPTAELVRLRGGILGVDLVHEIAKAYLMPGAGNGKGAGSDSGGSVGAPGVTDGNKGSKAGGVARVDERKAVGGESTFSPSTSTSNRSNKDGVPASPPAKQKSRAGRSWEGFNFDRFALPLKKKDDHNDKSNRDQPKNPRGSGKNQATPSASSSNDNGNEHYPGSRGTNLFGMDRNELDRSADQTETRIDSGVGGGGGGGGVGGGDEEDPMSVHEQIERLRTALEAAAAESEAGGVGVMDNMGLPRVGAGFQPKRQQQQRQQQQQQQGQPGAGSGGGGGGLPLSSSAGSLGTGTGLSELHGDGHGGWEWNEGPNESGNGSPNGNGRSGDGQVEDDVDISVYADEMGGGGAGGGWEEDGDEDDFDTEGAISAARAAAAAARAREEIAFLREVEALSEQAAQNAGMPPPLGEHVKAVVTKDVPFRFADELGAQVATALAMAVFKGVTHTVMAHRGEKKPEKVSFSDVVGCDEAKDEIKQIVDFLVDPSAYDKLGAKRPKGILLVGPPGTGKTLIAKACAGEAGVPFLYACGSDFNGIYVGMGVAAVKRLFAKARRHKKSIIYIDEIDYLGRSRNSGARDASGATQDREATLNQLLSEMDGFEGKDGIVVMASTNRKDILDDALLRSGRFDMQVDVERPDRNGREQLFSKYIAPLKLSEGCANAMSHSSNSSDRPPSRPRVNRSRPGRSAFGGGAAAIAAAEAEKQAEIEAQGVRDDLAKQLADLTPYMTGADVANVCATAGRIAARAGSSVVTLEHFSAAVDRVCHGLEKPGKMVSKDEQRRTAVHEAGHAVVGWMLPWCDPVVKVSIVWRGNALGFSQSAMTERLSDMRENILDNVCMTLAGRAAEEVVFGTISGGASSDLRKASRALYTAITEIGFGSATGLLSPGDRRMSERVLAEIDQEVQNLLAEQYQRALSLIHQYHAKIDILAEALVDKGTIHKGELEAMLGEKVTLESATAMAPVSIGSADSSADGGGVPASGAGAIPSVGEQGNAGGSAPLGVARVVDNGIYRGVIDAIESELEEELEEHADGRYDEPELEIATRILKRPRFSFLRSHLWKQPAVWFAARSVTGLALSKMKSAHAAAAQNRNNGDRPFDRRSRQ